MSSAEGPATWAGRDSSRSLCIPLIVSVACIAGCAVAPDLSKEELQAAWKQAEFERGQLPVGRVISVEKFDIDVIPVKPDYLRYAALAPVLGYGASLAVMHLNTATPLRAGYRHAVFLDKERQVITFELIHPYAWGQCVALRAGLDRSNVENSLPVLSLPGECASEPTGRPAP